MADSDKSSMPDAEKYQWLRRESDRKRFRAILALTYITVGLAVYLGRHALPFSEQTVTISAGFSFILGLATLLTLYLRVDHAARDFAFNAMLGVRDSDVNLTRRLDRQVAQLKSDFAALQADRSVGQHAEVLQNLRTTITSEIVVEVEKRLSSEVSARIQTQEIRMAFGNSYTRLSQALDQLNRRGNVNLVIGVITTTLAAGLLAYMALRAPTFTDTTALLSHYIPRISTVIFIEVFSFFFLRLYKATLAESKFYQTELLALTNTDIALQAALKSNDVNVLAAVIAAIAKGRKISDSSDVSLTGGQFDVKGVADIMEKFGKLAVDASKAKS